MIGIRELAIGMVLATGTLTETAQATGAPPWGYAPDRVLFTWVGRVDRELVLSMRGPALREGGIDGWLPSRARVMAPLPRTQGLVLVRIDDGRGYVDVIEQPNAWNGYTALIRILDPRGGADGYRLTVYWDRDSRGNGRRAPVWYPRVDDRWDDRRGYDPRWDDRRGYDPQWDGHRNVDPRRDDGWRGDGRSDLGRRDEPQRDDRRGNEPGGNGRGPDRGAGRGNDRPPVVPDPPQASRKAKPRPADRGEPPRLLAPDTLPESLGTRPPGAR